MDYATACTLWTLPEPSHRVQKLINQFFTIADSREDNAGDRFAEDVFIADGVFMLPDGTFTGASGKTSSTYPPYSPIFRG